MEQIRVTFPKRTSSSHFSKKNSHFLSQKEQNSGQLPRGTDSSHFPKWNKLESPFRSEQVRVTFPKRIVIFCPKRKKKSGQLPRGTDSSHFPKWNKFESPFQSEQVRVTFPKRIQSFSVPKGKKIGSTSQRDRFESLSPNGTNSSHLSKANKFESLFQKE